MTKKTVFIADLHLDKQYPQAVQAFFNYIKSLGDQSIDELYILGDLFEYWLGDDCIDAVGQNVAKSLAWLSTEKCIPIYYIHGNRDFLLGQSFAQACNMKILPEHHTINLYGVKTLLLHGDTLCTDDLDYMRFRQKVRDAQWQKKVTKLPVWLRKLKALHMRIQSKRANNHKSPTIMDANQTTVKKMIKAHDVTQLIHGHTHRPNIHHFNSDGKTMKRYVVGDWHTEGSALEVTAENAKLITIAFK